MPDSIKKRYSYKLFTNMVGALMNLITLTFVLRTLGPEAFGKFDFVTTNLTSFLGILTPGFETAYFNWISRKGHKENTDVATGICLYWGLVNVLFLAFFICLSIIISFNNILWPDIPVWVLWLGLGWASLTFIFQLLSYLADGKAFTVSLEKIRLGQNFFRFTGLFIIFSIGLLNLASYFLLQILLISIAIWCLFYWLVKKNAFSIKYFNYKSYDITRIREFTSFCIKFVKPLVFLSVVSFGISYFDRWFLQFIGGSSEQGFYSLALRLGAVAMLFTSSMTPIIMREFGQAYENNDFPLLRKLFERIEIFIFISAVVGVFLSFQSSNVVQIFGGEQYNLAIYPVSIMFLAPVHQTLGQLSTSLLNATSQTLLYSKITLFQIVIGFPITYILIAPAHYLIPGLGLGSIGLALKLVIVQILITNIFLFYNARFLKISYKYWLWVQIRILSTMFIISYLASFVSAIYCPRFLNLWYIPNMLNISDKIISSVLQFVFAGAIYCSFLVILIYFVPSIAGLSHVDISNLSRRIRQLI